jgi:hypothetical protein
MIKREYTFTGNYIWEELTDLTEIQELLFDNHSNKITTIMKSKKVEDLVYPDVIHLESQEQLDEILKYNKKLYKSFKKDEPDMLFGQLDSTTGCGKAHTGFYNNRSYNIYKFSDIIFPETKKEPVVKLEIGNHYEITDFKGNKEVVEIVNIHTDIQKMNNLFNSTWNLESNTCIYEHKHISGDILINSDTTKRFDYFSDNSPFAKSAKLVEKSDWLCNTILSLTDNGNKIHISGNQGVGYYVSDELITETKKYYCSIDPFQIEHKPTISKKPTIQINTQEETKIQIKFKKSIKI